MPSTDQSRGQRSGTRVGAYLLGRVLGRGSMAVVYEATHEAIGRRVAIKIIDPRSCPAPQALQRFLNEARLVNEIAHPGIVEIYDHLLLEDGAAALVMELLRGETLGARLRRRKSLPVSEVLRITRQIAAASAAVHQRGYAHRDLKPDNVMLIPDAEAQGRERAKVLDFGVARILPGMPDGEWQVQTHAGLMLGTPQYMAPEQCQGTAALDERVDCYALGVMLYQMLSGEPPFVAAGLGELFAKHLYLEPAPLGERAPEVPPALAALTHALLRKRSDERPSMREVVGTLEGIAAFVDERRSASLPPIERSADRREKMDAPTPSPEAPRPAEATMIGWALGGAGTATVVLDSGRGERPSAAPPSVVVPDVEGTAILMRPVPEPPTALPIASPTTLVDVAPQAHAQRPNTTPVAAPHTAPPTALVEVALLPLAERSAVLGDWGWSEGEVVTEPGRRHRRQRRLLLGAVPATALLLGLLFVVTRERPSQPHLPAAVAPRPPATAVTTRPAPSLAALRPAAAAPVAVPLAAPVVVPPAASPPPTASPLPTASPPSTPKAAPHATPLVPASPPVKRSAPRPPTLPRHRGAAIERNEDVEVLR